MKITLHALRGLLAEALGEEEEYSRKDGLIGQYSDMYKERHGIRPRWMYATLAAMSEEEIEAELDKLAEEPYDDDEVLPSEEEFRLAAPPSDDVRDGPVDPYENLPSRSGMGRRR